MSDSPSSRTRSLASEATDNYTNKTHDRWTHNISYRHLVLSSCIGIVQIWWHPYIHDLPRLLPFLFLYNIFSIFVGYPMFYLELALGVVTRKGVMNCWDLCPMARGVGVSMLITSAFTALVVSTVAAWCLAMFVHSFHSFLPWLHCAASAAPACAARHRPMPPNTETPAQSFFFTFVLRLKRDGLNSGMGAMVSELSVYFVLCWMLIYCIVIKRIYSYSKLVLFKDVMAYFVLMCCALGVTQLDGGTKMFHDAHWASLYTDYQIWCDAVEYALIEMTVCQGSLVMLGAYCPRQQHSLTRTVSLSFSASKSSSMIAAFTLGAAHGVLTQDYDSPSNIPAGSSASMILWSDVVARIPGSQFWSALVFFTFFVLALSSAALLVQTIMSSFTGKSIRKITWAFLVVSCLLFCLIGIITMCTQGGVYIQNFIMRWPVQKTRILIAAVVSGVVTYVYGQTMFCEDVFFAVGEYPCIFLRVCWAVMPTILSLVFIMDMASTPTPEAYIGWVLVLIALIPVFVVMLFYIVFKFRVRDIVGNEK